MIPGMRRKRTLTEILVLVAFITVALVFVFALVRGIANVSGADVSNPEKEAREWAQSMGLNPTGVACARMDSDGDGYVSCTVSGKKADGSLEMYPIECASILSLNSGCRMQKPAAFRRP